MKEKLLDLEDPLEEFTRLELDILSKIVKKYNDERSDLDMENPDEKEAYKSILEKLKI